MTHKRKDTHHLDPKLDIVFKMLFAAPRNKEALIDIITAVINPASPILELEVLNRSFISVQIYTNRHLSHSLSVDILLGHATGVMEAMALSY